MPGVLSKGEDPANAFERLPTTRVGPRSQQGSRKPGSAAVVLPTPARTPPKPKKEPCIFKCGKKNTDYDDVDEEEYIRWGYPNSAGASCYYCLKVY